MASVPPDPPAVWCAERQDPALCGVLFCAGFSGEFVAGHLLVEGKDYTFEADGRAPALTATGLERMLEAHAAGRDVAIEIDQIVVFRLPAWWG